MSLTTRNQPRMLLSPVAEPQVTSRTVAFCAVPMGLGAGMAAMQAWACCYHMAFELARQAAAQEDFRSCIRLASLN